MTKDGDELKTATDILRDIYGPKTLEQLAREAEFIAGLPKPPPKPWYVKLYRKFKYHMYEYNLQLAGTYEETHPENYY